MILNKRKSACEDICLIDLKPNLACVGQQLAAARVRARTVGGLSFIITHFSLVWRSLSGPFRLGLWRERQGENVVDLLPYATRSHRQEEMHTDAKHCWRRREAFWKGDARALLAEQTQ